MDNPTLDERCAELKARMLGAKHKKPLPSASDPSPAGPAPAEAALRQLSSEPAPAVIQTPIEIRNPHPLVKAALSGIREVGEDYGRLQFRWRGHVDVRVNKVSARRALKIFDTLFKRVEALGLRVEVGLTDRGPYYRPRETTFITDGKERLDVTIIEKTRRKDNPAWIKNQWSINRYLYDPTGRLSLLFDADSYHPRSWSDKRGHRVEDYLDLIVVEVRQTLEAKGRSRIQAEEDRRRENERQRLKAEADRQEREHQARIDDLKRWADAWAQAEKTRAFLAAWERNIEIKQGAIQPGSSADGFRRWVALVIDQIDPL